MMPPRLHVLIGHKRTLIVEMFVSEVRVFRLAPSATNADIAQDMDAYLGALCEALLHAKPREAVVRVAVEHAQRRARMGWNLRALLTEFGLLRSIIVEVASQTGAVQFDEWESLASIMHESMVEAAAHLVESARPAGAKMSLTATPTVAEARSSR